MVSLNYSICNRPNIMLKVPLKECSKWTSGVASLDLMLGHTFYNRPCLATGMLVHTCFIYGCCLLKSAKYD